jgi:hypothetical protein
LLLCCLASRELLRMISGSNRNLTGAIDFEKARAMTV